MPCQDTKEGSTNCVGRSFGTNDDWSYAYGAWHATHVIGIMGAMGGNNQGTTSVMPTDNNICWVVGQVFPDTNSENGTHLSSVYKAVVWSIGSKGVKVVNMSLSGGYTETGRNVMGYAKAQGAIIVAGAGNTKTFQYEYPASYVNDNVLSVGAVDAESQWASFSTCNDNLGISAPGVTKARSDFGPYRVAGGTSMAAAHVSGIIAMIWSVSPLCSDVQVTQCIKLSAKYLGDYAWCFDAGLVQVEDAYTCLAEEENCC